MILNKQLSKTVLCANLDSKLDGKLSKDSSYLKLEIFKLKTKTLKNFGKIQRNTFKGQQSNPL